MTSSATCFVDEAPLRSRRRRVHVYEHVSEPRPRDGRGRSLREFDLRTRLFRYHMSYMIYSEAFDGMPPRLLERVYRRLYDVLSGNDTRDRFAALPADDRRIALEIVRETKASLPAYWQPSASGH